MTSQPTKKFFLFGPPIIKALLLFFIILTLAIFSGKEKAKEAAEPKIQRLESKNSHGFVLAKFYTADWCFYCKKLKKALDENPETKDWQEIIELIDVTNGKEGFTESIPVIFPIINGEEDRNLKLLDGYSEKLKSVEYLTEVLKKALKLRKEILAIKEDQTEQEASNLKWQKFSTDYFYRSSLYANCLVKREAVLRATTDKERKLAKKAYESALEQYAAAEKEAEKSEPRKSQ